MNSLTAQAFDPAKELVPMSKERDMLQLRVCRIDLGSFCRDIVPEFAPLGGGRPDCAVVMGQLVSQYNTQSMKMCGAVEGCYLPPDVVDTGMAFLCAPVLITSLDRELDVKSPHDTVACRLQLEAAEEFESLSAWIPQCGKLKLSFSRRSAILETPTGFLSYVPFPMSIDLSAMPCVTLEGGFAEYSAFTDVRLPATVREFGDHCFSSCENLAVLDLASTSVRVLPYEFADECTALTDVRFPATLEEIGGFYRCQNLAVLDLTSTCLRMIHHGFAAECEALTDVRFPHTLEEIGARCFRACNSLAAIDLSATQVRQFGPNFAVGCPQLEASAGVLVPETFHITEDFVGICRHANPSTTDPQ